MRNLPEGLNLLALVFALGLLFLMIPKPIFSQRTFPSNICKGIKYDTLTVNFLIELNSEGKFYYDGPYILVDKPHIMESTSLQDNLVYLDYGFDKNSAFEIYKSDSVIITYWAAGYTFFQNKDSCLNLTAISKFRNLIKPMSLTHKEKRKLKKSTLTDHNGVKYLRVTAKIIVLNGGKAEWLYPYIYCMQNGDIEFTNHRYCKKIFHTL
jgi:hypothetical protein